MDYPRSATVLDRRPAMPIGTSHAGRSQYLPVFLSAMAFYAAITIGLHYFLLQMFANDYLERNWLAFGDDPYAPLTSTIAALIVAHFAASGRGRSSDFLFALLAIVPIMPMLAIYATRGAAPLFMLAVIASYIWIWLLIRLGPSTFRIERLEFLDASMLPRLTLMLTAVFIAASAASGNLQFFNLSFGDVYEFRGEAIESRGAILEYMGTNLTGLLLPLSLAIALGARSTKMVAALLFSGLLIFGFTSHKSHFFISIFVISVFLMMRNRRPVAIMLLAAAGLVLAATLLYVAQISDSLAVLAVRRLFFVPAYLNFIFNDFYTVMPKMWWSDNRITLGLVHNPYGMPAARVISTNYSDGGYSDLIDQYSTANTGFIGAGFAEGGYIGILLYSSIVALLLRFTNLLARKVSFPVCCAGLVHLFGAGVFGSTDTITMFLTYGVGLFVIVTLVLRPDPALLSADAPKLPAPPKGRV